MWCNTKMLFHQCFVSEANRCALKRTERFHPSWVFQGYVQSYSSYFHFPIWKLYVLDHVGAGFFCCCCSNAIHKCRCVIVLYSVVQIHTQPDTLPPAALTGPGVLVDYLRVLKEMKTQMNNIQNFFDAHIGLLEELTEDKHQEPDKG